MKSWDLVRYALSGCVATALLSACGGSQPPIGTPEAMPQRQTSAITTRADNIAPLQKLPRNLLYVVNSAPSYKHTFIAVFNAEDESRSPRPIYTIRPQAGGNFANLAVDQHNDLFAAVVFANGTKLEIFPSGHTKPTASCVFKKHVNPFIVGKVLYLATQSDKVAEYSTPFVSGKQCAKPLKVLTDQRAELRGTLSDVAADPSGDVFDTWYNDGPGSWMDEFPAGSTKAHDFAYLGAGFTAWYVTSDTKGNIITAVQQYHGDHARQIAVFPRGSRAPKLFHAMPSGAYYGFAVGINDSRLFVEKNYPQVAVDVFQYDEARARVGELLYSFPDSGDASGIAVFSSK